MAALLSRPFIASSLQKTSRAWRRQARADRQHVGVAKPIVNNNRKQRTYVGDRLLHSKVAFGPRAWWLRPDNKKSPGSTSRPGLLGAALLNTLSWKILVTRVN
jgi:hypothetical protein